ncbi:hypothetical protein HGB07_05235 [Candidatus Roizmanbacteria bacterium]|nr:hypothetical protein [Candidatus Roizmanbacteria bacterium]
MVESKPFHTIDYAISAVRPQVLAKHVEQTREKDTLSAAILDSMKYRLTAFNFLMRNRSLPPEQQKGIVYFVGLVGAADDVTDNDPNAPMTSKRDLEEYILNQEIQLEGDKKHGKTISIGELKEHTLNCFPESKKKILNDFLDSVLEAQLKSKGDLGEYGYEQAFEYRRQTSEAYSRAGLLLAGVTDEAKIEEIVNAGIAWQWLDDIGDLSDDVRKGVKNLVAGVANDIPENELKVLKSVKNSTPVGGHFKMAKQAMESRRLLKQMPKTRAKIQEEYTKVVKMLPGYEGKFLRQVGRMWLKDEKPHDSLYSSVLEMPLPGSM